MYYNANLLAILAASIGSLLLAFFWYSPKVFGAVYRRLTQHESHVQAPENIKKKKIKNILITLLANMIQASVLYFLVVITRANSLAQIMTIVFFVWVGFNLTGTVRDMAWKGRSFRLAIVEGFLSLFSNIVMMFILILVLR